MADRVRTLPACEVPHGRYSVVGQRQRRRRFHRRRPCRRRTCSPRPTPTCTTTRRNADRPHQPAKLARRERTPTWAGRAVDPFGTRSDAIRGAWSRSAAASTAVVAAEGEVDCTWPGRAHHGSHRSEGRGEGPRGDAESADQRGQRHCDDGAATGAVEGVRPVRRGGAVGGGLPRRQVETAVRAWVGTASPSTSRAAHIVGRAAGLSDAEIYLTTRPITEGSWDDAEQTILQTVDDLYTDDCVSD